MKIKHKLKGYPLNDKQVLLLKTIKGKREYKFVNSGYKGMVTLAIRRHKIINKKHLYGVNEAIKSVSGRLLKLFNSPTLKISQKIKPKPFQEVFEKNEVLNNKENHKLYIGSGIWKRKRKYILNKRGKKCEICTYTSNESSEFHVHHKTYRRWGKENQTDLQLLCINCHHSLHKKYSIHELEELYNSGSRKANRVGKQLINKTMKTEVQEQSPFSFTKMNRINKKEEQFTLKKGKFTITFNFFDCNRVLSKKNLSTIKKSIEQFGQLTPIMVTRDGYIIDGQHRYTVLKELGKEIWYIVNNTATKELIEEINNVQKHWGTQDRVKNQSENGLKDVILLKKQYPYYPEFTLNTINEAFCRKTGAVGGYFKRKDYSIDIKQGAKVLKTCLALSDITSDVSLQSAFVRGMVGFYRLFPEYSIEMLVKKAAFRKIHVYNNRGEITEEILEVYNRGLRKNKLKR